MIGSIQDFNSKKYSYKKYIYKKNKKRIKLHDEFSKMDIYKCPFSKKNIFFL